MSLHEHLLGQIGKAENLLTGAITNKLNALISANKIEIPDPTSTSAAIRTKINSRITSSLRSADSQIKQLYLNIQKEVGDPANPNIESAIALCEKLPPGENKEFLYKNLSLLQKLQQKDQLEAEITMLQALQTAITDEKNNIAKIETKANQDLTKTITAIQNKTSKVFADADATLKDKLNELHKLQTALIKEREYAAFLELQALTKKKSAADIAPFSISNVGGDGKINIDPNEFDKLVKNIAENSGESFSDAKYGLNNIVFTAATPTSPASITVPKGFFGNDKKAGKTVANLAVMLGWKAIKISNGNKAQRIAAAKQAFHLGIKDIELEVDRFNGKFDATGLKWQTILELNKGIPAEQNAKLISGEATSSFSKLYEKIVATRSDDKDELLAEMLSALDAAQIGKIANDLQDTGHMDSLIQHLSNNLNQKTEYFVEKNIKALCECMRQLPKKVRGEVFAKLNHKNQQAVFQDTHYNGPEHAEERNAMQKLLAAHPGNAFSLLGWVKQALSSNNNNLIQMEFLEGDEVAPENASSENHSLPPAAGKEEEKEATQDNVPPGPHS